MRLKPLFLAGSLLASGWILTGAGCVPGLLVPPARVLNGESPGVLYPGAVSAGIDYGGSGVGDVGARVLSGNLVVGMGFDMDARVSGTAAWMQADESSSEDIDYFAEAGRDKDLRTAQARLKWNPLANGIVSLIGGAGAGTWEGRRYYSLEAGYSLGIENPYFVPYFNYRWLKNVPLDRDTVVWNPSSQWDPYSKAPQRTFGREIILGFRVPLRLHEWPALKSREASLPYFKVEVGMLSLKDGSADEMGFEGAVGLEIPLRYAR